MKRVFAQQEEGKSQAITIWTVEYDTCRALVSRQSMNMYSDNQRMRTATVNDCVLRQSMSAYPNSQRTCPPTVNESVLCSDNQ
eukprot:8047623-Pyramimonas_sp.AAC.1